MEARNNVVRWGVGGIFLFLPLISSAQFFFASTFTQSVFFLGLASVGAAAVLSWHTFRDVWSPTHVKFLSGFVAALLLATIASGDITRSLWSSYERMWGMVMQFVILGFVFTWSTVFRGKEGAEQLLRFVSIGVSMVSIYALVAWGIHDFPSRIDGSIGNAAFLAAFLLLGIFILITYGAIATVRRWLVWYGAGILALIALVLTGTRSALLGLLAGMGVLMMLTLYRGEARDAWGMRRSILRKVAAVTLIVGAVGVVAFIPARPYLDRSQVDILHRLGEISLSDRAAEGRLLNWQLAWEGIKDRPIFGWGPEQYHLLYDKHYDPRLFRIEPWVDRAHNNYLDVAATGGFVAVMMYLGVLAVGIYGGWKLRARMWAAGNAVISGIVAYGVNAIFLFDTLWTWIFLLVLVSVPYLVLHDVDMSRVSRSLRMTKGSTLGGLVMMLIWFGVILPATSNFYGKRAYDALAAQNDDEAFRLYAKAVTHEQYGSIDIDRSIAEYVFDFVRKGGKRDNASLVRATKHAQAAMDRNIAREPENGKWWLWAGQLASLHTTLTESEKVSMLERSANYLKEAHVRMPNRPQVLLELAQVYRVQGNTELMRKALDQAIALLPTLPLSHANAAVQYIYAGDRAREEQEITWLRTVSWAREGMAGEEDLHSPERDLAMIRDAYYNVERFRDAANAQAMIVERDEERFARGEGQESLVSSLQALAAIQARSGDRAGARISALRVLELAPALRGEVESFLQGLGF